MPESLRLKDDRVAWRDVGGEVVALDLQESNYLGVNASGAVLWDLLAAGTTEAELAQKLVELHAIDDDVARRDVAAFVADLRARALLED